MDREEIKTEIENYFLIHMLNKNETMKGMGLAVDALTDWHLKKMNGEPVDNKWVQIGKNKDGWGFNSPIVYVHEKTFKLKKEAINWAKRKVFKIVDSMKVEVSEDDLNSWEKSDMMDLNENNN